MRTTITILFIALLAWMAGSTWYWVCKVKGHCEEVAVATGMGEGSPQGNDAGLASNVPAVPPFTVTSDNQALMTFNNNLRFGKSGAIGLIPGTVRNALDSLAAHLKSNPNRDVEITGYYAENETNDTDFQNLGLARANFIKQALIERGIAGERVIASFMMSEDADFFAMPDTLIGGIDVALLDRALADASTDTEVAASATARSATAKPDSRNLYFAHNRSNLAMDTDLRNYISKTIQYLNQHPDARLVLTGHTDGTGKANSNLELGRKRASTVKKYFQDFGLAANRIHVTSKGESSPIADNKTEAGKQKNRRVEVSVSE